MIASNSPHIAEALIVRVAVSVPLRRLFDYRLSPDSAIFPQPGMRIKVPFGPLTKIGIIDSVVEESDYQSPILLDKLKSSILVIDEKTLVPDTLLKLYRWMQKYYHAPPGEIWQTLLPTALLKGQSAELSRMSRWHITDMGLDALTNGKIVKSAIQQRKALRLLKNYSDGIAHDNLSNLDLSYTTLKTLAGKHWVSRDYENAERIDSVSSQDQWCHTPISIELNSEQSSAIDQVSETLNRYAAFLLFGITASGKTEVYLRLIEQVLKQNKQALVLVPEIGLTPQTLARFKDRFSVDIVLLHSGITEQQRLQAWLKARNGIAKIIIGTRSAVFVPLLQPGIIIIDEEHDLSFRQQQGFRYSARDVAMVRANIDGCPIVLGSASPSLESLMNVEKGKMQQLDLTQKAKTKGELGFRVIDLKNQPMQHGLSRDLITAIKQHLHRQGQVLLFLNRRGYAPVLLCHQCGWSNSCSRCDQHFTYHHQNHHLQCHHCGSHRRAPNACPQCNCPEMIPVGLGTERLEESVQHLFPDTTIARIDRDTTRRKSAMKNFVSSIKRGDVDILIGTQMLAKGHHFPDVTLVALVDMDGALYSADFRAPEYAAQLITQVSGRAGRAEKPGEVIIQTHHAEHPMLHQVIQHGYAQFAKLALEERLETELPPANFAALFQAESPALGPVKTFLQDVKLILDRYSDLKVELMGPAPAVYVKKAGKIRYQLFLQTQNRDQLHRLLELTLDDIEKLKSAAKVRWRLEIDPIGDS